MAVLSKFITLSANRVLVVPVRLEYLFQVSMVYK